MVSHGSHTEINHVRSRSLSPQHGLGGSGSWPFFPAPSSGLITPLFILAFTLPPMSTCRFSFPGLILVPLAHTQSGWGVVVKAEKHCSVWHRVFNCSNGSLSFVLCRHIVQGSFLHQRGCVRFFQKLFLYRSCPFF